MLFRSRNYSTNLKIYNTDLHLPWKNIFNILNNNYNLENQSMNVIFCNFALHYLINNKDNAENIVNLINYYLKKGGEFIFTALDGKKVFNLLKKNNNKWEIKENNKKKYYIKLIDPKISKFEGNPFKHKIEILLPCSSELYEEVLINIEELDKLFKKYNIIRIEEKNHDKFINEFQIQKPHFAKNLNKDDILFISLYKYYIYKKL